MLKAMARRQQAESRIENQAGAQYDQAMFPAASQTNWPGSGQYNLPGAEGHFDFMDATSSQAVPQASSRQQSSPYSLPVSEINIARQILQSTGNRGFEQTLRGNLSYGASSAGPIMPSPNAQQVNTSTNIPQKIIGYQPQMGQQRPPDMQFPYY